LNRGGKSTTTFVLTQLWEICRLDSSLRARKLLARLDKTASSKIGVRLN
jgi:hypothetical protein